MIFAIYNAAVKLKLSSFLRRFGKFVFFIGSLLITHLYRCSL